MAGETDGTTERSKQTVFFIARIGAPGSEIRFKSDMVLDRIIRPAAAELGFGAAIRADDDKRPGHITRQVIERIISGDAVVADLTGHNPNVYYEVALAHAARVPLVQIIEAREQDAIPFDLKTERTITYSEANYGSYEVAMQDVQKHLQVVVDDPAKVDNPVVAAKELEWLHEQTGGGEANMAAVMLAIDDLRADVRRSDSDRVRTVAPGDLLSREERIIQELDDFVHRRRERTDAARRVANMTVTATVSPDSNTAIVAVIAVDSLRKPVADAPVDFAIAKGDASLADARVETNTDGVALVHVRLGAVGTELVMVVASCSGVSGSVEIPV